MSVFHFQKCFRRCWRPQQTPPGLRGFPRHFPESSPFVLSRHLVKSTPVTIPRKEVCKKNTWYLVQAPRIPPTCFGRSEIGQRATTALNTTTVHLFPSGGREHSPNEENAFPCIFSVAKANCQSSTTDASRWSRGSRCTEDNLCGATEAPASQAFNFTHQRLIAPF